MEASLGGLAFAFVAISQVLAVVASRASIATPSDRVLRKAPNRSANAGLLSFLCREDRRTAAGWIKQTC